MLLHPRRNNKSVERGVFSSLVRTAEFGKVGNKHVALSFEAVKQVALAEGVGLTKTLPLPRLCYYTHVVITNPLRGECLPVWFGPLNSEKSETKHVGVGALEWEVVWVSHRLPLNALAARRRYNRCRYKIR
jgi:hypothetical protein